MQNAVKDIIGQVIKGGACALANDVRDIDGLIRLFFSPQGVEFCTDNNLPTLDAIRALSAEYDLTQYGIYVDAGAITLDTPERVALIGDTRATVNCEGVKHLHKIILMHGAKATVKAENHAVVKVENAGCELECVMDNTAIML